MSAHQTGVETATKDDGMVSKAYAGYVDKASNGREPCFACSMFRRDSCTYVRGTIDPNGHCKFWKAK